MEMRITFFTNLLMHHQTPLADELYKLLGDDYRMVVSDPMPDEFIKKGYPVVDRPYVIKLYEGDDKREQAMRLAINSDIVIFGDCPDEFFKQRMAMDKPSFRFGERHFKKICRYYAYPSFWMKYLDAHTRYRSKPLYWLGASAYGRFDNQIIGAYPGKCLRWAYLVSPPECIEDYKIRRPKSNFVKFLWCATICDVKRPEMVVKLAKNLSDAGYNFHIDMIGEGGRLSKIVEMINDYGVGDKITIKPFMPNHKVLEQMQNHDIFLFTSEYGEGWGVVLNEAMGCGMAVISSNRVGAAPFLIKHKENGLMFKSRSDKDLFEKACFMIDHYEERARMGDNARKTIVTEWSPRIAAKRLIHVCSSWLESGKPDIYKSGLLSKAPLIWSPSTKM